MTPRPTRAVAPAAPIPPGAQQKKGRALELTAYAAAIGLVGFAIREASQGNPVGALWGTVVIFAAILPGFLWIIGRAKGFPIFPIFAAPFALNYGVHFMTNAGILKDTTPEELTTSGLYVTMFLLVATAVWYWLVCKPPKAEPIEALVIHGNKSVVILFLLLSGFVFFWVANAAGWLWGIWRYYSILRAVTGAFGVLSTFALAYLIGTGELKGFAKFLFVALVALVLLAMCSGLYLFQAFGVWLLTIVGYVLGAHRVPWLIAAASILAFSILHNGKYAMREKYWSGGDATYAAGIKPWDYPGYYAEWLECSLGGGGDKYTSAEDVSPNMLERASLLQMYLMAERLSPLYGYLNGATYSKIPALLMPRILNANRMTPTAVNALVSIHYRMQTPEEAENTSIAWGLFNEAYANYGYRGQIALAVVIGLLAGAATRWTMGYPVVSFRGLFAIMLMNIAAQFDQTSGTLCAMLSQSTIAIVGLSIVLMQKQTIYRVAPEISVEKVDEILRARRTARTHRQPQPGVATVTGPA